MAAAITEGDHPTTMIGQATAEAAAARIPEEAHVTRVLEVAAPSKIRVEEAASSQEKDNHASNPGTAVADLRPGAIVMTVAATGLPACDTSSIY